MVYIYTIIKSNLVGGDLYIMVLPMEAAISDRKLEKERVEELHLLSMVPPSLT